MRKLAGRHIDVYDYDRVETRQESRSRGGIIWQADFLTLPLSTSANASQLRAALAAMGLTFSRASSATVQTSASEVVTTGIGVDDPRVGMHGLVIEEARTNLIPNARNPTGTGWAAATSPAAADVAAGPDGLVLADRFTIAAGARSNLYPSPSTGTYTGSVWVKRAGAVDQPHQLVVGDGGLGSTGFSINTAGAVWARRSATATATGAYYIPVEGVNQSAAGGQSAQAQDVLTDLHQHEAGKFATELILTTGAAATRAADRLKIDSATRIVRDGRVRLEFKYRAKGARVDHTQDIWHFFYDSGGFNGIYLDEAAGTMICYGKGVILASDNAFSFDAGDVVELYVEIGNGIPYARARVNGGAVFVFTFGATPHGALDSAASVVDLFNIGGAGFVNSWAQHVRAYAPGKRPSWAA